MFKDPNIRYISVELCKQIDRLDVDDQREVVDTMLDILTTRRKRLGEKVIDFNRYNIQQKRGHYEVCKDGNFFCTADTYSEAEQEILAAEG